jgi:hypothetical protein
MEEEEQSQGMGMGIIKYLLLFLVVFIVVFVFYGKINDYWKQRSDSEICRQSIELHAAGSFAGLKTIDAIKCPPRYLTVDDGDRKKIMKQTADLMADCYWKFGENKYDLFSGRLVGDERFCALCTHITFKGSARNQKISEFRKYLTTEPAPKKYGGTTYAEYIMGRPTDPTETTTISQEGVSEIDTNQNYGILFLYVKNEHLHSAWAALWGTGAGGAIGLGGAILLIPDFGILKAAALIVASGAAGGLAGGAAGSTKAADWQSAVLLVPLSEEGLKALSCTQMPVAQDNK